MANKKKNDRHIFCNQRYFDTNHFGKSANSDCSIVCKRIFKLDVAKLKNLRPRSRMNT